MPYISSKNDRRKKLRNGDTAQNAGELNYQIFHYIKHAKKIDERIIEDFVHLFLGSKPNYQKYNDMTGCLIRCKKEVERRLDFYPDFLITIMESYDEEIAIYEDLKIKENSDVE